MDLEPLRIDRSEPAAGPPRPRWPWLVGGAVVVAVAAIPLVGGRYGGPVRVRTARVVERVPGAAAAPVGAEGVSANGYVVASRRAALSADTPGRIVEMNVTEGSLVEEGDVVARLFSEEYAAALQRAEAEVAVARAAEVQAGAELTAARDEQARLEASTQAAEALVGSSEADVVLARHELARVRDLQGDGVATTRELDAAQAAIDGSEARLRNARALLLAARKAEAAAASRVGVAEAALEVAAARVRAAEAVEAQAAATYSKTEVRAPFAGIVVLKDAEVGEVVSPNSFGSSNARGSVVTMVDFDSLEVQVDVPERTLSAVEVGAPARVYLDAYPQAPYAARVSRIWPTADRQKATVEVRLALLRKDARLRPDLGARVVFLDEEPAAEVASEGPREPVLVLPEAALVRVEGETGAFVVAEGAAHFRPVRLGDPVPDGFAVEGGLSPGDLVVVEPPPSLESGDAVVPEEAP